MILTPLKIGNVLGGLNIVLSTFVCSIPALISLLPVISPLL